MAWDVDALAVRLADALPVSVRVDGRTSADHPVLVLADATGDLATIAFTRRDDTLVVTAETEADQGGLDPARAATVLVVATMRAIPEDTPRLELRSRDPIWRAQARRLGFEGALRESLARAPWSTDAASPTTPSPPPSPPPSPVTSPAPSVPTLIATLLPDTEVRPAATHGLPQARTSGRRREALEARRSGDRHWLRVSFPDRDDTLAEQVGMAIDTALAVRVAFGPMGHHLRDLSFDLSEQGFRSGKWAGVAHGNRARIAINASYLHPEGLAELNRMRRARGSYRPPAGPDSAWTWMDSVTAHECWHVLEQGFMVERPRDYFAMMQTLGEPLGVASLERATLAAGAGEPDQPEATARLAAQVSPYATTNPREATAELFNLYWCGPRPWSPLVATFAELIERDLGIDRER